MKIYKATRIGGSAAMSPNANNTATLRIVNFLKRHGWEAADQLIMQQTGVSSYDLTIAEKRDKAIYVIG